MTGWELNWTVIQANPITLWRGYMMPAALGAAT
jgi:hypothetical protein